MTNDTQSKPQQDTKDDTKPTNAIIPLPNPTPKTAAANDPQTTDNFSATQKLSFTVSFVAMMLTFFSLAITKAVDWKTYLVLAVFLSAACNLVFLMPRKK